MGLDFIGVWKQIGEVTCLINKAYVGSNPTTPISGL